MMDRRMIVCKFGGTSVQDAAGHAPPREDRGRARARAARRRGVGARARHRQPGVARRERAAGPWRGARGGRWRHCTTGTARSRMNSRVARRRCPPSMPPSRTCAACCAPPSAASWHRRSATSSSGRASCGARTWSTAALTGAGIPATWVDARQVIITDDRHGRATPQLDAIRVAAQRVHRTAARGRPRSR